MKELSCFFAGPLQGLPKGSNIGNAKKDCLVDVTNNMLNVRN
jgi:hypothetical protein